jgi:hypothetical protein
VSSLLTVGDDLETVANTNVPPGRLAFRKETLNEEKRLMMLSTRRNSRANTIDSLYSENDTISSLRTSNVSMITLPPAALSVFSGDGLGDVEEGSETSTL